MRDLAPEILAQLDNREGLKVRNMLWVQAKNRTTGEPETIGIWNGADAQNFVINGETRTYYGSGNFITFDDFKNEQGLLIHRLTARVNGISPEMDIILREYDTRLARVEVHLVFYDPLTNNIVADPYRFFKGWINTMNIPTPEKGGVSVATINMVGHARILTRYLAQKRSHESQRRRLANDAFFQYVSMTGSIQTPWGTAGVASNPPSLFAIGRQLGMAVLTRWGK